MKVSIFYILFILALGTLNFSYAQNTQAPASSSPAPTQPAASSAQPAAPAQISVPVPGAAPAAGSSASGAGNVKYEEYMSICRSNEYDTVADYSDELKARRINFLKEKIEVAGENSIKLQFRLAKEYLDQFQKNEFLKLSKKIRTLKLSKFENNYLNALILISENSFSKARMALNDMLSEDKQNIDVLNLLAEVYLTEENYFEATAIYNDLNKFTNNAYLVQECESVVLNSLNAEGEAICLKAANKFPANPFPYIYVGIAHRERENFKKSVLYFKRSIAIKPTEMALTCLAEIYSIRNELTEAAQQFQKSIEFYPDSERASLGLAWTQFKLRNFKASLEAFKNACALNSKNEIQIRKAYIELHKDQDSQAKDYLKLAESCSR